jgi:hypothetical protein
MPPLLAPLAGLRFVRKIVIECCLYPTTNFPIKHSPWPKWSLNVGLWGGDALQQKEHHWTRREILKAWAHHNDYTSGGLRRGLSLT